MLLIINNSNRNPKIKAYLNKQADYNKHECILEKKKDGKFPLYVTDTLLKILRKLNIPYKDISTKDELIGIIKSKEYIRGIIITGSELKLSRSNIPDELLIPSMLAIKHFNTIPIFGICLGFQLINKYYGGEIESMDEFVKSMKQIKFNQINTNKKTVPFFTNKHSGRYNLMHGDHLTKIGKGLIVTAEKNDVVYAIEHKSKPIIGVQFHPELSGTKGQNMLINFAKLCYSK